MDSTNGQLSTGLTNARQQALNNDLQATVGNAVSSLASRGIVNSITDNALNDQQERINTLAATICIGVWRGGAIRKHLIIV